MFQLWACKQVLGVAATNGLRSRWTDGLSSRCPSCKRRTETCAHVIHCNERGRVETLQTMIGLLREWLVEAGTDPDLTSCLIEYAAARNSKTMEDICRSRPRLRDMAKAQDGIGWRRFMEGMIASKLVEVQAIYQLGAGARVSINQWASALVIKLLEIVHGQWLYRNVVVHDETAGAAAIARKEDLQREIEHQQELGEAGLLEEDAYLLDIPLEDLEASTGERQHYWLLAITAAREACQLTQGEDTEVGGQVPEGVG